MAEAKISFTEKNVRENGVTTTTELNLTASCELNQFPQKETSKVKYVPYTAIGPSAETFLELTSLGIGSGAEGGARVGTGSKPEAEWLRSAWGMPVVLGNNDTESFSERHPGTRREEVTLPDKR